MLMKFNAHLVIVKQNELANAAAGQHLGGDASDATDADDENRVVAD
jgi:hypothetical protein